MGVIVGQWWGAWRWRTTCPASINWAEMVAVELGLLLVDAVSPPRTSSSRTSNVLVRSDNMGVANAINAGRAKADDTNEVLKRIYRQLALAGRSLTAIHVPGITNISDGLSRGILDHSKETRVPISLPAPLRRWLIPA